MTQIDFVEALARYLSWIDMPYSRLELKAFVMDAWSLIQLDPNLTEWADAFIDLHDGKSSPG